MTLRIPKGERENMAALVSAKPELTSAIGQALKTCSPALVSTDLSSAVLDKVRDRLPAVQASSVTAVIRALLGVYSALREAAELDPAEAAKETIQTIRDDEKGFGTPVDGWPAFQKRIEELLSDDAVLGLSAKAASVSSETERHIHGFRVLTDARPIFGKDPSEGPRAFAVIHTLQVRYYEDGREHEWFIALDGDDLESMQLIVERALTKEKSLRTSLNKLNVPVLSWKVGGDVE
jgi:hypothetical protein